MFDFNILIEAYKKDIDYAREYLYNNIMALCTKELMSGIDEYHHQDIVQDVFMKIDERIQASIPKGFSNKQIYCYVKLRISGFIINYFKFEIGKNYIDTNYMSGDDTEGSDKEYTIEDMTNFNEIPGLLLEGLHECSELEMRMVMLHHYMGIPVGKISEITGHGKLKIYKRLKSGMTKLREFLETKGVTYEDLC